MAPAPTGTMSHVDGSRWVEGRGGSRQGPKGARPGSTLWDLRRVEGPPEPTQWQKVPEPTRQGLNPRGLGVPSTCSPRVSTPLCGDSESRSGVWSDQTLVHTVLGGWSWLSRCLKFADELQFRFWGGRADEEASEVGAQTPLPCHPCPCPRRVGKGVVPCFGSRGTPG